MLLAMPKRMHSQPGDETTDSKYHGLCRSFAHTDHGIARAL